MCLGGHLLPYGVHAFLKQPSGADTAPQACAVHPGRQPTRIDTDAKSPQLPSDNIAANKVQAGMSFSWLAVLTTTKHPGADVAVVRRYLFGLPLTGR